MADIVYMLQDPLPLNGVEFRHSLRSLNNITHDTVWAITPRLPSWVNTDHVHHIEWVQVDGKYEDLSAKWRTLPLLDQLSDNILYMDDDMYAIRPALNVAAQHQRLLEDELLITGHMQNQMGKPFDVHTVYENTLRLLREHGVTDPYVPIQHSPFPLNRHTVPVHLEDGNGPYEYKTLTYNLVSDQHEIVGDPKAKTMTDLQAILGRNSTWLSSDDGLSLLASGVARFLTEHFPTRSKYEHI